MKAIKTLSLILLASTSLMAVNAANAADFNANDRVPVTQPATNATAARTVTVSNIQGSLYVQGNKQVVVLQEGNAKANVRYNLGDGLVVYASPSLKADQINDMFSRLEVTAIITDEQVMAHQSAKQQNIDKEDNKIFYRTGRHLDSRPF
ncbi:hypothetical protein [Psittacicella hinzii]|uniref:Lipopolysaccharide export system protein LptA n=1 Tax=Psittacicella hinzii TaxID=2028575 RepID=A0A3A1YLM5_9GAMM|nr:hypothetical protein [Psittacicella hinzii]RIY37900.1 hypothetical protein CKF58_04460 [Psittacicella hinzii]